MMKLLLPLILAAPLVSQELQFYRTERDWPASMTGVSASLVAGQHVPDHVGRSVLLMRAGQAYLSFQPLQFDHFAAVGTPAALAATALPSARQLAPLPNHDGTASDRVAAVVAGGVDLWRYDNGQFVSVAGGEAAYAGAVQIRSGVHHTAGGPENHFVAFTDSWVQGGVHMADDTIVPGPRIPTPANTTVWDVATVDWVAGGMPEIVVLSSAGIFVLDFLGNALASQAFPVFGRGSLCAIDQGGTPGVTAVIPTGSGQWFARTWQAGSTTTWDSPTFLLPSIPNGIVAAQLTDDAYSDVVVSCTDHLERVMIGTANGPTWQNGYYLRKHDPSATPSHTASVLDDIDRDGELDLVLQADGSEQLVVVADFAEQMHDHTGQLFAKAPVPTLSSPEIRGLVTDPAYLTSWQFPQNHAALIVRFDLPTGLNDQMEVRCYQYGMQGDVVDTSSVTTYYADLPTGASGGTFDMMIPVPLEQNGTIVGRLLEFTLVDNGNDGFASKSVLGRFTRHPGEVLASVLIADMMDANGSLWLIKPFSNVVANWGELVVAGLETILHPNQNSGNSSRYLGGYEPTEDLTGQQTDPVGAAPLEIPSILL
ncbi:MAG: hypothetical protein ACE37K_15315 [Planctomycetota bacterium]